MRAAPGWLLACAVPLLLFGCGSSNPHSNSAGIRSESSTAATPATSTTAEASTPAASSTPTNATATRSTTTSSTTTAAGALACRQISVRSIAVLVPDAHVRGTHKAGGCFFASPAHRPTQQDFGLSFIPSPLVPVPARDVGLVCRRLLAKERRPGFDQRITTKVDPVPGLGGQSVAQSDTSTADRTLISYSVVWRRGPQCLSAAYDFDKQLPTTIAPASFATFLSVVRDLNG